MLRSVFALITAAALAAPALSHFIFIVPQADRAHVQVVFSETLEPDEGVAIAKIADMELFARSADGKDLPVKATADKHALTAAAPKGAQLLFGSKTYGVLQKKANVAPFLLSYHAKAALNDALADKAIGERLIIEIVPSGKPGSVRFQALAKGKPLPKAEFTVLVPGGDEQKVTADENGYSPVFTPLGRYGVWTKWIDPTPGEHDGKKYAEARHYATFVGSIGK